MGSNDALTKDQVSISVLKSIFGHTLHVYLLPHPTLYHIRSTIFCLALGAQSLTGLSFGQTINNAMQAPLYLK